MVDDHKTQTALDTIRQTFPVGSQHIQNGSVGTDEAPTFVNSTVEELKVLRGIINTTGTVVEGLGFTLTSGPTGRCTINFTAAFSDVPAVTYGAAENADLLIPAHFTAPTASAFQVYLLAYTTGALTDGLVHFQAIGPR